MPCIHNKKCVPLQPEIQFDCVMEKIEYGVKEGLDFILQYIKATAIYTECGKPAAWFNQRYKESLNRGVPYRFSSADIEAINTSLTNLGNKLRCRNVSNATDRSQYVADLKSILAIVKPAYLRDEVIGKTETYWRERIKEHKRTDGCYRFSDEEVKSINEAVGRISTTLLQTSLKA